MESKIVKCVDCGLDLPRKGLNRQFRCPDCAMSAVRDTMTQLHEKSGPYYEKWKQSVKNAASKL